LVNEAYLRLARPNQSKTGRAGPISFAVAARAMRQDPGYYAKEFSSPEARRRRAQVELGRSGDYFPGTIKRQLIDLHEALERLGTLDSRKARVVELKYLWTQSRRDC